MEFKFIDNEKIIAEIWDNEKLYDTYTWEDYERAALELGLIDADYFETENEEGDITKDIFEYADNSHNAIYVEQEEKKYFCTYNTWADGQGGIMVLWDANTKKAIVSSHLEYTKSILILPSDQIILEASLFQNFVTPPNPEVFLYAFKKNVESQDKISLNIEWNPSFEEIENIKRTGGNVGSTEFKIYFTEKKYYIILDKFYGVISEDEFQNAIKQAQKDFKE